jgi:hypothetical protein
VHINNLLIEVRYIYTLLGWQNAKAKMAHMKHCALQFSSPTDKASGYAFCQPRRESLNIAHLNQQMQGETSFALRVVGDGDFTHLMQTLFREGQCIFTSSSCIVLLESALLAHRRPAIQHESGVHAPALGTLLEQMGAAPMERVV